MTTSSLHPSYWHKNMSEEVARRVLGSRHFDYAVSRGAAYCHSQAGGAWMANEPELFGAYRAAELAAVAKTAGSAA